MLSTNIVVIYKDGAFVLPIITAQTAFSLKFDTGAIKTVISAELLFGELSSKQRDAIKTFCSEKYTPEIFTSASGHSIIAYPCYSSNVIIGNTEFEKFYYYIVIDKLQNDKQIALLGNNFISCCELHHEPNKDIIITSFKEEDYFVQTNGVDCKLIMELL